MPILIDLNIPFIGSVENAKLLGWQVAEGATYRKGDLLFEVETDKTANEVEADEGGILVRRLAKEGDEYKVGDRVGLWAAIGTSAEAIARALAALDRGDDPDPTIGGTPPAAGVGVPAALQNPPDVGAEGRLSPLVRKLAREHNVDLALVIGTGPGGRITGDDVLRVAQGATPPPSRGVVSLGAAYASVPVTVKPHSLRRKTIARRLSDTARTACQLTADMQIDLSAILAARERTKITGGKPASVLSYFALAVSRLLSSHPGLNASFTDEAAYLWSTVNLGIAVDTDDGLIVPVIRDAQLLGLEALGDAIASLATRARANALRSEELEAGTFTISNPGSLGPVIRAEAILNTPQVALLGLPGLVRAPVAIQVDGEWRVEIRPVIRPSLTFDHRAIDGGAVIAFLNDLRVWIEEARPA